MFRAKDRCRNLILKMDFMEFHCQDVALCVHEPQPNDMAGKKEPEADQKYHVVEFSLQ